MKLKKKEKSNASKLKKKCQYNDQLLTSCQRYETADFCMQCWVGLRYVISCLYRSRVATNYVLLAEILHNAQPRTLSTLTSKTKPVLYRLPPANK